MWFDFIAGDREISSKDQFLVLILASEYTKTVHVVSMNLII